MQKKEVKRLQIPDDVLNKLAEKNLSVVERVRLAEDVREQYGYPRKDVLKLTGIPNTLYSRCLHVIHSGNLELYREVAAGNITLSNAVMYAHSPSLWISRNQYPIQKMNSWNIIVETKRHLLYTEGDNCYLRIISYSNCKTDQHGKQKNEQVYQLDNAPYAINTVCGLLNSGCKIRTNLAVLSPKGIQNGTLKHHILGAYYGLPIKDKYHDVVRYCHRHSGPIIDIRAKNLWCHSIAGKPGIIRKDNEILIWRNNCIIARTDYTKPMYDLLRSDWVCLHTKSRDKRVALFIDGEHDAFLYHVRMAEHVYGLPADKGGLIETMDKFRSEYLDKEFEIDHLDCDGTNNCLSNLMIMSKADNILKGSLTKQIRLPYFCWLERYDEESIKMQAGYCAALRKPIYMTSGVYSAKECLKQLREFVHIVHESKSIIDYFDDLPEGNK